MTIAKYRPTTEVEAVQLTGNTVEVCLWLAQTLGDQYRTETHPFDSRQDVVMFRDSRGEEARAVNGDWIVKGMHGFFVVQPGDFAATYEPV